MSNPTATKAAVAANPVPTPSAPSVSVPAKQPQVPSIAVAAPGTDTPTNKGAGKVSEPKFKLRDDLSKSVRDFFKKQFVQAGEWKYESKLKGPANRFYFNQKVEVGDGLSLYSIDINYDNVDEFPFNSTVSLDVTKGGIPKVKLTAKSPVAAINGGVEVEATSAGAVAVTVDGVVGPAKFSDKIESTGMEAVVTYTKDAATVGAYGRYKFKSGAVPDVKPAVFDYGLATRYAVKGGLNVTAFTTNLLQWSLAAAYPFTVWKIPFTTAVQLDGQKSALTPTSSFIGLEGRLCSVFMVRAKVSLAREFSIAFIEKIANNTTVSVSLQRTGPGCCGIGYGAQITSE